MAAVDHDWENPELSEEESNLIRAYAEIGRPLDALAYTSDFERLVSMAGIGNSDPEKHKAFTTLLNLRKRGRLPRHVHTE